jgi:hypothetical protein
VTAAIARAPTAGCARCASPLEDGDLRCAVCALACPHDPAASAPATHARILRCTECGAAVAFVAEVQAPRCSFCRAVMRVEEPHDPIETAELMLPFRVARADAQAALRAWLGRRGWMCPGDLASAAAIESLEPICWAAWIVDARALVSWAADSDEGSEQSAWAPHSGAHRIDFQNLLIPASRGLTRDECDDLTTGYTLEGATPVSGDGVIERFDAQRSAARRQVTATIEATAAERLQQGAIPGRRFRKVKVGVLLERMSTRRVAMPAWILAYRYGGRPYRAVVHGQDPRRVTGRAPLSTWKLIAVIAAIAALIALIVAIVAGTR